MDSRDHAGLTRLQAPSHDSSLDPVPHLQTYPSRGDASPPSPSHGHQAVGIATASRESFKITIQEVASIAPKLGTSWYTKKPTLSASNRLQLERYREFVTRVLDNRRAIDAAHECGISINTTGTLDETALHVAARCGAEEAVALLIKSGADVDMRNQRKITPLHIAAANGRHRIVELLLKGRADPDICDTYGKTPLMVAAMNGHCSVITRPLHRNADMETTNVHERRTSLHHAMLTISEGSLEVCTRLLEWGADPDCADSQGQTALMLAVVAPPNLEMISLFLDFMAAVNLQDDVGQTALHWALSEFVNLTRHNVRKEACIRKETCVRAARSLIQAHASTLILDRSGRSPLAILQEHGHHKLASGLQALQEEVPVMET